jgi:uncharacterized protein (TIGR03435 family)
MTRTAATLLTMLGAACGVRGQGTADPKSLEVASVKLSPPYDPKSAALVGCSGGPGTTSPGFYSCHYTNLQGLIIEAFGLSPLQIPYSPSRDHTIYDIMAKVPAGSSREEFKLMLQRLLVERFKLTYHVETKEIVIYELTIAKGGPKLKESQTPPPTADSDQSKASSNLDRDEYGFLPPPATLIGTTMTSNSGVAHFVGRSATIGQMARALSTRLVLGCSVTDRTGLTGKYDFTLNFSLGGLGGPESALPPRGGKKVGTPDVMPDAPSLFEVLQHQLGLKLDKTKGSMDVFLVDHAEKVPVEQ